MAFPTSPSNNQVHKEGNRTFVFDSATSVWDRVREVDSSNSNNDIQSGNIGPLVTGGAGLVTTPLSHRNLIINGDFKIWQRSNSTSSVNIGNGAFQADRWKSCHDVSPEGVEFARSTEVPAGYGFANSLKITCDATDTSVAAGHQVSLAQELEAQNLMPWCYGTSNAKNLTLSFWVKTNLTGSHSIGLIKHDNTRYGIPINYTVSNANTWEKKEILISPTAGSTSLITSSGGAVNNDNGLGASLLWNLASGSNYQSTNNTWVTSIDKRSMGTSSDQNFVGSTSNNFYITGVQLEVGSTATPFEHRSYGDALIRCQRYYQKSYEAETAVGSNTSQGTVHAISWADGNVGGFRFAPRMRGVPTVRFWTTGGTLGQIVTQVGDRVAVASYPSETSVSFINVSSGAVTHHNKYHFDASAEL